MEHSIPQWYLIRRYICYEPNMGRTNILRVEQINSGILKLLEFGVLRILSQKHQKHSMFAVFGVTILVWQDGRITDLTAKPIWDGSRRSRVSRMSWAHGAYEWTGWVRLTALTGEQGELGSRRSRASRVSWAHGAHERAGWAGPDKWIYIKTRNPLWISCSTQ